MKLPQIDKDLPPPTRSSACAAPTFHFVFASSFGNVTGGDQNTAFVIDANAE
jgi:hypothetical protein